MASPPSPSVTYGRSARHPASLQDSGQSVSQSVQVSCSVVSCNSLFLSEKSLPLIFVHSSTLGVGHLGGVWGVRTSKHTFPIMHGNGNNDPADSHKW